jgi:transposase
MKNKKYTEEFKKQAVQLADDLGSTIEASRQLGIDKKNIHNWKEKYLNQVLVLASRKSENKPEVLAAENLRLKQENIQLKKVNQILKAAAAFFSQDHLK